MEDRTCQAEYQRESTWGQNFMSKEEPEKKRPDPVREKCTESELVRRWTWKDVAIHHLCGW